MSDYISKEALLEELNSYEKELYEDKRDAIDSDDEMVLFAIQNQETAISRITRSVMHSIPTLDEKEIICKYGEKIIEKMKVLLDLVNTNQRLSVMQSMDIVKKECGISE